MQKLQLNDQNNDTDNSPIAPILVTPAAKKFQRKLHEQNIQVRICKCILHMNPTFGIAYR